MKLGKPTVLLALWAAAATGSCARAVRTVPPPGAVENAMAMAPFRDLQGTLLRSWAPGIVAGESAATTATPLPIESALELVAERTRAGRLGEAEQILNGLDASPEPLIRLASLVFRAELEYFRLAYIGGGYGGGEARLDQARSLVTDRQSDARINAILAALPKDVQREANLAVQANSVMSMAAEIPSWIGFVADHHSLEDAPNEAANLRTSFENLVGKLARAPGIHPQFARWIEVTRAGLDVAEGDSRGGLATLSALLATTTAPCGRAELRLRRGDAYVAPFGPAEMLGQNAMSVGDAIVAMRASILVRGSIKPSGDARARAAAEYAAAAADGCDRRGFAFRLTERRAYLEQLSDRKVAAASYDTAADQAAAAGSTRDALRMHTIAALFRVDLERLGRLAATWARSEDVGGRRSILALVAWYGAWLAEVGRDLTAARRTLDTFNNGWSSAGRVTELVELRGLLANIHGNIGLLDAATRFDEQAAAAARIIVSEAERLERELPSGSGQGQIANVELVSILQRQANRIGLQRIDDDSKVLEARQDVLLREIGQRAQNTAMHDIVEGEAKALVDWMRAQAAQRSELEKVRTCAQRAEKLKPRIAALGGLDRAEVLLKAAACRADWVEQSRRILDRLDPLGPFEAAGRARDPRFGFRSQNAVDLAAIDVRRAFRAAASAESWRRLGVWVARLQAFVDADPSMARYRRYATFYQCLVQLHTGAAAEALQGLEQLRGADSLAVDSEVELGVLQAMAEAYVAAGAPLQGLWAAETRRLRVNEISAFDKGLRPGDPSGAEQAALDRQYALTGFLNPVQAERLAELQHTSRATPVSDARTPSPGDLSSVIDRLDGHTVVEVFDLAGRDAFVWCARRGNLRAFKLAKSSDYWSAEVGAYWAALANGDSDRTTRGRNLFDNFLNVCHLHESEGLVIVGVRGPLDHALEPKGEVIERRAVIHAEALWEPAAGHANAVGAFVMGVNTHGLQSAEAEADEVAGIIGATPTRAAGATQAELLRAIDGARYIHIAADGHLNPDNPYSSFLSLGPTQHVEAWELFLHAARAELLTLSACDTGVLHPRTRGYSFASLAHLAGTRWVLASQWPVIDAATATFMGEFYRLAMQKHVSFGEAFRAAKLLTKRANEGSPSVYAPFALSVRSVGASL